ncbi:hypothetical protein D3C78_1420170 [compost metagenome]
MDIADGKVAVQRLADPHRALAAVVAAQSQLQACAEADFQRHVDRMWPAGQPVLGLRTSEQQAHLISVNHTLATLPGQIAYQSVEGGGVAAVLGEQGGGIARQIAEPGPAHRHATAYRLSTLAGGLFTEPDQRRLAKALVAQNLCALFGNQQLGLRGLYPPAG